jgi:hypothetical protein
MLNKRTLPNLRPGENVLAVTADRMADGLALAFSIAYRVDGQPRQEMHVIHRFPYYFRINVPDVPEEVRDNYDQHFNEGRLQMEALRMCFMPREGEAGGNVPEDDSLDERAARAAFARSYPHPADLSRRQPVERPERDVRESSGFFPQSDGKPQQDDNAMQALIRDLRTAGTERRWVAAEDLGAFPKALGVLLETLPGADGDLTLFLCKALARIKDRRALPALLEKWKRAPNGAPGSRYIPDALAAIGDRSVVPALVAPLGKCRFDFRFHIAHALGVLGGPEAEKVLNDLAQNDPLPAVREEAARALAHLKP